MGRVTLLSDVRSAHFHPLPSSPLATPRKVRVPCVMPSEAHFWHLLDSLVLKRHFSPIGIFPQVASFCAPCQSHVREHSQSNCVIRFNSRGEVIPSEND